MSIDANPRARTFAGVDLLVILGIATAMFIVGSIADLRISAAAYQPETPWAVLLAAIGEWPTGIALIVAGVFLIRGRHLVLRGKALTQAISGGILIACGAVFFVYIPTRYLNVPTPLIITVGIVLSVAIVLGTWRLANRLSPAQLIRSAAALALLVAIQLIVINLVKIGWARPRMRMVEENPDLIFQPWWEIGSPDKPAALARGIAREEFKSFPSGHTANAAVLMYLLPLLAWISTNARRYVRPALYFGFAWALAVAASRIVVGAHFLTDVAMGLAITFITALLIHRGMDKTSDPAALQKGPES